MQRERAGLGTVGRIVRNQRWRSGVPLGGIGCGKIELLTDGAFGNFTCNHNWDRPTEVVRGTYFALRDSDHTTLLRLKRPGEYNDVRNVTEVAYNGLFPRALARFGGLGIDIELEAFAPLIPHNIDDSSLPVALFTFRLRADERKDITLLFSWENLLGWGGRRVKCEWNDRTGNTYAAAQVGDWAGLRFATTPDKPANVRGEYLVLTDGPASIEDGKDPQTGVVARSVTLEPDQTHIVRFLVTWYLPEHHVEFRKRHKIADTLNTVSADAVLDGNPQSKWETNAPTIPGESLVLDLGAPRTVDRLVVNNFMIQGDFTAGFTLDGSSDGEAWHPIEHRRERVRTGVAEFTFDARELRYLRVNQTGYGPDWKWSVAQVNAWLNDAVVPIATATGHIHAEENETTREDLGHYYSNRFATADALAQYVIDNAARLDDATREWQDLIIRSSLPEWLKVMLLNHAFPVFANGILTRDGRFSVAESPVTMDGALGTMDQRMAHHAFWLMMFPELDRRELALYADTQDRVEPVADGRIPHFCGNFHNSVGDPMVDYGTTDWPDLSCSWVMQVLKHYRWTGNREFLETCWPHVKRTMAWLAAQDTDGDLIPEGGSTYDYEHMPRGGYVFTASVYLGALRAADEMARVVGEDSPYAALFEQVQQSTLERLFDEDKGTFIKWRGIDRVVENTFIAPLAGDWMMRLSGLEPIFPAEICDSACRELLARHAKSFHPIPPMEVTPDGQVFTKTCFVLQHEPYLGCESIYLDYVDDGIDVIKRVYDAAWDLNWSPWDCPLNIEAPHGRQSWLLTYMTTTAVWHVLPALAGMSVDLPGGILHFAPRTSYHGPVFFPTFWGWLDCDEGDATLRVLKAFVPGHLARVNDQAQELEIRERVVWDLSAHARLPRNKTAPVGFPDAQPQPQCKPWTLRSVLEETYDPAPIRYSGALDDDPRTCWTTDRAMRPGDWLLIDLGTIQDIPGVRMDHREQPDEIPHGLRVEVSEDHQQWHVAVEMKDVAAVTSAIQNGWLTVPVDRRGRWIRLTQLGQPEYTRWTIHGIELNA